ncbi:MAG TPA: hypothetical protein VG692_13110 [Gemmatimonadales bacterium]|nr:hypothetical protein [Gemmatimonadales bacterium]
MVPIRSRRALLAALATGLVLTGACGKKAPPPPAEQPAATPAPPPPPPLAVAGIDLGKAIDASNKVAAPMTTFGVRDTIYASVSTTGAGTNATLQAKWTFVKAAGGEVAVNESSLTISPTGPVATEFHITKASAWPKGKYKVEVSLNGTSAEVKEFDVK